jgi:hypothetical protein
MLRISDVTSVSTKGGNHVDRYVSNPASLYTDQGANALPMDLRWSIHREWRVIYYAYRHAAGLPLWEWAEDFIALMAEVLCRLSSGSEPIAPVHSPPAGEPERDPRRQRVYQLSCRIYPAPVIEEPEGRD